MSDEFLSDVEDNYYDGYPCGENVRKAIEDYAGVSLNELNKKYPDLLIFPHSLKKNDDENDDKIGDQVLFSFVGKKVKTGNIIGFFSVNDVPFTIRSRFDKSDKQFFLHYMVKKVLRINMLNLRTMASTDGMWDLCSLLFPYCLKNALRQGLFKAYRHFSYNDARLNGSVDVSRHLLKNTPFAGKFAYQTRERTADNPLIQLVRHTIEFIRANAATASILQEKDTRAAVDEVVAATPSYARGDRAKVIAQNLRPVRHPYFTDYTILQKVCLKILRREKLDFQDKSEKLHGIVFDAAWLWEEYLATVLKGKNFTHALNKKGENGIDVYDKAKEMEKYGKTYNQYTVYPDFYIEGNTVIDAKYKRLNNGVFRDDRFQLISYMHILKAEKGFLAYPIQRGDEKEIEDEGKLKEARIRELNGFGGTIGRLPFYIPQTVETEEAFEEEMKKEEEVFLKSLENAEK